MISETTRAFAEATTDLQKLLDTVASRVATVVGDACSILILSDDGTLLVPSALADNDPVALALSLCALTEPLTVADHKIAYAVMSTGEPFMQPVIDLEELRPPRTTPNYFEFARRIGMHSMLIVALRARGETIGILVLTRHGTKSTSYVAQDLSLAQILADHAALAIANSRLFDAAGQARSALLETELSHQRFFELSPLAFFIFDTETAQILEVNNAALQLYGYSRAEIMALRVHDLGDPSTAAATAMRIASLGTNDLVTTGRARRRDGVLIEVEGWSNASSFAGRPARFVALMDITERASLRQARASEARFRDLLEGAPDAVVLVDRGGDIVLVNGRAEKMFGHERSDLVGQHINTLIRDRTGAVVELQTTRENLELRGIRGDRSEFPVEVSLSPLHTPDGIELMSVIRDVTEREQSRAALVLANRELEAFSYSVAHDLRAPLRAINAYANELVDAYKDRFDHDGVECLEEILGGSRKMGGLIDALLALARMSRTELKTRPVDLSEMVRVAAAQLAVANPDRSVEIVVQDGLHAELDPTLIEALLDNVLGNAWKFTGKIAHPRIEFSASDAAGARTYCIRDNGAGFDMQYAANLFAPFQRVHPAHEFPGTGVGLATAQRIVHRHGGRIWVDAAVDRGAAFFFTLPGARSVASH